MPCGGAPYGDNNLVFIANDWHTALLPVYLQVSTPWASASGGCLMAASGRCHAPFPQACERRHTGVNSQ